MGAVARLHDEVILGDAGFRHEGFHHVGAVFFAGIGTCHDGAFVVGQAVFFIETEQENGKCLDRLGGRTEEIIVGVAAGRIFDAAFGYNADGTAVEVFDHAAAGFGSEDGHTQVSRGKLFFGKSFLRTPFKKLQSMME